MRNPAFDEINKTFFEEEFGWKEIRQNCRKFFVFHSNNDPYIPLSKAQELAKNLEGELILVKNAGHFNSKAGFTKFEQLLEKIRKET